MQRQRRSPTLQERIERVRRRAGGKPTAPMRRRRVPRYQREAKRQRMVYWGMGLAGALVVAILLGGYVNDHILVPNHVLATVGDTKIRRTDYWKVSAYNSYQEAKQYRELASLLPGDQASQYAQQADFLEEQARQVWGSTDTDEDALNTMIDDQVFVQHMGDLGLTITDEDINNYILTQFEPRNAPLFTPTPTPTWIPARIEMATATASAEQTATAVAEETALAAVGAPEMVATPEAIGSPLPPDAPSVLGTPVIASPIATALADAVSTGPPGVTPLASPPGSPLASPEITVPTEVATPNPEQARATAEAGYQDAQKTVFERAHLSRNDYIRWIVRPAISREKVKAALDAEVGQSAEQVHAAHILVETKDLSQQLYDQLIAGADFAQLARDNSSDEGTAGNGGDLGWFPRNEMVGPFEQVAFTLPAGQISQPFESQFGWHIVKVLDPVQERPLTEEQITSIQQRLLTGWLDAKRAETRISSEFGPTPTPSGEFFEPPAEAPPAPTPTFVPEELPIASPVGTPEGVVVAEPTATPLAGP